MTACLRIDRQPPSGPAEYAQRPAERVVGLSSVDGGHLLKRAGRRLGDAHAPPGARLVGYLGDPAGSSLGDRVRRRLRLSAVPMQAFRVHSPTKRPARSTLLLPGAEPLRESYPGFGSVNVPPVGAGARKKGFSLSV